MVTVSNTFRLLQGLCCFQTVMIKWKQFASCNTAIICSHWTWCLLCWFPESACVLDHPDCSWLVEWGINRFCFQQKGFVFSCLQKCKLGGMWGIILQAQLEVLFGKPVGEKSCLRLRNAKWKTSLEICHRLSWNHVPGVQDDEFTELSVWSELLFLSLKFQETITGMIMGRLGKQTLKLFSLWKHWSSKKAFCLLAMGMRK